MTKTALITGGTGGIGTAICRRLADNGYQVAASYLAGIDDIDAWQTQQQTAGYHFHCVAGDVADFDSAQTMVTQAERALGHIDVLVNGAGITRDALLRRMKVEQWQAVLRTNLDSVFNVSKAVLPLMSKRRWGRIINIASVNGQRGQAGQTNYAAAKAGMHGFTMSLAQEVARQGITVNTISPGYVNTAMLQTLSPKILATLIEAIPVGRLAEPEEIAWAVQFLADDQAGYITGANLAINGGMYMSA